MTNSKDAKTSKNQFGTFTAAKDANNDYTTSNSSSTFSSSTGAQNTKAKQSTSKTQYGTLTAKEDMNNDYE